MLAVSFAQFETAVRVNECPTTFGDPALFTPLSSFSQTNFSYSLADNAGTLNITQHSFYINDFRISIPYKQFDIANLTPVAFADIYRVSSAASALTLRSPYTESSAISKLSFALDDGNGEKFAAAMHNSYVKWLPFFVAGSHTTHGRIGDECTSLLFRSFSPLTLHIDSEYIDIDSNFVEQIDTYATVNNFFLSTKRSSNLLGITRTNRLTILSTSYSAEKLLGLPNINISLSYANFGQDFHGISGERSFRTQDLSTNLVKHFKSKEGVLSLSAKLGMKTIYGDVFARKNLPIIEASLHRTTSLSFDSKPHLSFLLLGERLVNDDIGGSATCDLTYGFANSHTQLMASATFSHYAQDVPTLFSAQALLNQDTLVSRCYVPHGNPDVPNTSHFKTTFSATNTSFLNMAKLYINYEQFLSKISVASSIDTAAQFFDGYLATFGSTILQNFGKDSLFTVSFNADGTALSKCIDAKLGDPANFQLAALFATKSAYFDNKLTVRFNVTPQYLVDFRGENDVFLLNSNFGAQFLTFEFFCSGKNLTNAHFVTIDGGSFDERYFAFGINWLFYN